MKKTVIGSILASVAVFALLGVASASVGSSALDTAVSAVNMQLDTISFDVAHCGTCGMSGGDHEKMKADMKMDHGSKCGCGCKDKCGCSKPKCGGDKCGCSKPKCGCEKKCGGDKCGCSKPKCGKCETKSACGKCGSKDKCGCSKPKCGCGKCG